MERGNEHDVISLLHFILVFSFQLPVCFVDKYQNTRSSDPTH